ncbi:acyl-CoA thioesterase [Pontibacter ummariensis]|uniref:Acyl-CoA thioesterase n=1 Tax=Pontibacter ummariensis TaxID=1610492 RepID=A0A239KY95_9BACT|nr:hydroxyphenylacetyl-CoA thioesterase PaaI [Pontibacter ummariensis]PRY04672.1 acyl-CoA thioesterase [Pontibacter ummariensis]SNT23015.1 acyl-CoA thioesterase [Pontibacter ummariensis]
MHKPEEELSRAEAVTQRMLARDAFSKLLGLEVEEVREGYCRLHFRVREDMLNGFGILHGGVTYSAADSAFAFACNSHGRLSVALSTTMEYLEAGKTGDLLTVEAQEESLKHKVGVYLIRITNQEEKLVALFKGTSYRTSKEI